MSLLFPVRLPDKRFFHRKHISLVLLARSQLIISVKETNNPGKKIRYSIFWNQQFWYYLVCKNSVYYGCGTPRINKAHWICNNSNNTFKQHQHMTFSICEIFHEHAPSLWSILEISYSEIFWRIIKSIKYLMTMEVFLSNFRGYLVRDRNRNSLESKLE